MLCRGNEFRHFSDSRITFSDQNIEREVMLNDSGDRDESTIKDQNYLKQVGSIYVVNTDMLMSAYDIIPSTYL